MSQSNRQVDQNFNNRDRLYYRFRLKEVQGNRLLPTLIPVDNTSVNWSKYSKPWDVTFDHPGYGIASILVKELPSELPKIQPPGKIKVPLHAFKPGHVPLSENYSHSELWTYVNNVRNPKPNIGNLVKKEFRTIISDSAVILRQAKI